MKLRALRLHEVTTTNEALAPMPLYHACAHTRWPANASKKPEWGLVCESNTDTVVFRELLIDLDISSFR
jgi:hypothetical protein